jgi:hypothetical protein
MDSSTPKLLIKARRTKPAPGQLGLFAAPAKPAPAKSLSRKPPGGGWQAIPGGKSGGFRRKKGGSWEYWYPTGVKQKAKPKEAKLTARYFTDTMEKNGWHLMSQGPGYQVLQSFDRTRNLRIDKTGHGEWKMSGESEGTFGDLQSAQRAALAVMKTKVEPITEKSPLQQGNIKSKVDALVAKNKSKRGKYKNYPTEMMLERAGLDVEIPQSLSRKEQWEWLQRWANKQTGQQAGTAQKLATEKQVNYAHSLMSKDPVGFWGDKPIPKEKLRQMPLEHVSAIISELSKSIPRLVLRPGTK